MTLLPIDLPPPVRAYSTPEHRPDRRRKPVKITARWLTSRKNDDGSRRFYFQPRTEDKAKGWPGTVPLRDATGAAIRDPAQAARACEPFAQLYDGWLAGLEGHGPDRIVIPAHGPATIQDGPQKGSRGPTGARQRATDRLWPPGTVGRIVQDYEASRHFQKLEASTQADYRYTNSLLVEAYGEDQWTALHESELAEWLEGVIAEKPHMGHQLYRQSRAVFGKARLIYKKGEPGYIPKAANPFAALDLATPESQLIVWTEEIVAAFVAHCDGQEAPSFGDAALFMSWIGTRRQDWSRWPADFFDRDLIAFRPTKTRRSSNAAVVIPWQIVPELRVRIEAAKARLEKMKQATGTDMPLPSTFFYDDTNNRPWTEKRFGVRFRELRDSFAAKHPAFRVRYMVGLVESDPFLLPTLELTARSWRHTAITLLLDRGATPDQIRPITGHTEKGIKTIEKNYRALTADQAALALGKRTASAEVKDIKEAKG